MARDPIKRSAWKKAWYAKNRKRVLAQKKALYAADPTAARQRARKRYRENRELCLMAMKKYRTDHPEVSKNVHWRARLRRYGLTPEAYEDIAKKQKRKCPLCGLPAGKNKDGALHIDHCHKTKRVRGLLCFHCNAMLGHARDNKKVLAAAIKYLRRRRAR